MLRKQSELTAIRFPESLLRDLNRCVDRGSRNDFAVTATERALLQLKQARALKECRGIFSDENYPEFATPEKTRAWAERLRRETDERMKAPDEQLQTRAERLSPPRPPAWPGHCGTITPAGNRLKPHGSHQRPTSPEPPR